MKKLSIFFLSALALLGFASCEDDKEPVYSPASPDSFELLTPALQNQYYELTSNGTFELTAKSMPDFAQGHPIGPVEYKGIVSLTPDFRQTKTIPATNAATRLIFNDSNLAEAVCQLSGLTKEDVGYEFPEPVKVYFKVSCKVTGIEGSDVVSSNYAVLNKIMPYFAIPSPGFIFLAGEPEGWVGPSAAAKDHYWEWRLLEKDDEIGSKVYYGTFPVEQGKAMFRFYTALTGWDPDSYGSQEGDNPLDFPETDLGKPLKMVKGKGSYNFPDWPGGNMAIKVDMSDPNNMTVTCTAAE